MSCTSSSHWFQGYASLAGARYLRTGADSSCLSAEVLGRRFQRHHRIRKPVRVSVLSFIRLSSSGPRSDAIFPVSRSITSILISRFMLDLQAAQRAFTHELSSEDGDIGSVVFEHTEDNACEARDSATLQRGTRDAIGAQDME